SLISGVPCFAKLLRSPGVERILHGYTFGLKRALADLLCIAYLYSRRAGRAAAVTLQDCENAYLSSEYATFRSTISQLLAGETNRTKLAPDLICPIGSSSNASRGMVASHPAIQEYRRREAEAAARSMLSEHE